MYHTTPKNLVMSTMTIGYMYHSEDGLYSIVYTCTTLKNLVMSTIMIMSMHEDRDLCTCSTPKSLDNGHDNNDEMMMMKMSMIVKVFTFALPT